MRGSTKLAAAEKPEKMFVLMQCFIPLLGFITSSFNGEIVGLRGDGLIAAFGFGEGDWKTFINRAYEAGMVMIEASRDVLGPFLVREGVVAPNAVGVSIDGGQVTMTKIGFGDSVEVTAYGDAVNQAAKSCKGTNALSLSATINGRLHGVTAAETFAQKTSRLTGT
ncbi:MAG: hypothetical protein KF850_39690 [Labilithrix sp.]|nr:hypothetical protein [Labilithrix sp.]